MCGRGTLCARRPWRCVAFLGASRCTREVLRPSRELAPPHEIVEHVELALIVNAAALGFRLDLEVTCVFRSLDAGGLGRPRCTHAQGVGEVEDVGRV